MKKKILVGFVSAILTLSVTSLASASFLVEQYDDYWSKDVNELIDYADNNIASSSGYYDIIDFTDDPDGFAGNLPGSNLWPSAVAIGATGTSDSINDTFFAKITGSFNIDTLDTYTFRTYSDDGIFVYVDGELIINDPTLHPEQERTGELELTAGIHNIELYFFENYGEASLEATIAGSDMIYTQFNDAALLVNSTVPEPTTMLLFGVGIIGLAGYSRKKRK